MTGESLRDRYNLVEELERGQCLVRYLARDTAYDVEVEVDVVELDKSATPQLTGRLREVLDRSDEIIGDHIVTLLGWGEEEGHIYSIRERFDGVSLSEILAEVGDLPRGQVMEIVRVATEAMVEAYGKGLFYLGLNPGQILLNWRGEIRLVRVGYAWLLEEMDPILAARVSPYRAPETDEGKEGTRTSDVYSLAVMIREMLPKGKHYDRLDSLLEKSMSPLPKHRPSSPRLLLEALEEAEGRGTNGISASDTGPMSLDDHAAFTHNGGRRGGGLSFLRDGDASSPHVSLTKRRRGRPVRALLLIILGGMIVWLLYAAVTGSLDAGKDSRQETAITVGGADKVTLPDLQGLPEREAEKILVGLGLRIVSREAPSHLWSAGMVAAQEPEEGSILEQGDTVYVVISSGRDEGQGMAAPVETDNSTSPPAEASSGGAAEPDPSAAVQMPSSYTPSAEPLPHSDPLAPHAVASLSTQGGSSPLCVAMDGSGSQDPDGGIVRYIWDCGDGTILEGIRVQHVYDPAVTPARFQVVLQVFDGDEMSDSCAVTLEVY